MTPSFPDRYKLSATQVGPFSLVIPAPVSPARNRLLRVKAEVVTVTPGVVTTEDTFLTVYDGPGLGTVLFNWRMTSVTQVGDATTNTFDEEIVRVSSVGQTLTVAFGGGGAAAEFQLIVEGDVI